MQRYLRLARPTFQILALLAYSLGSGIAHYLGRPLQLAAFLLGLLAVLAMLAAGFYLAEYFRLPGSPLAEGETPRLREGKRTRLLQVTYASFTLAGAAVVSLLLARLLAVTAAVILMLILTLLVIFAMPPMKLNDKGYGELLLAVTLSTLLPAFSFVLQFDGFHRLIAFVSFPLTLLAIAWLLALDFPAFASDQKLGRGSLLTQMTWPRAVPFHHLLVLFAYLLFAAAPLAGFPWALVWPVFLASPFFLVQVLWLQRIAHGIPPRWPFFTSLATGAFGLCMYLLSLTFWIR
jgi:1,4-dihydroxy-2-naphthoate octaprenyltransferase